VTEIQLEIEGSVAIITLAAPERRNALTPSMTKALVEACEAIDQESSVGAAVVQALGASFCAGADRKRLLQSGDDPFNPANYEFVQGVYASFSRVAELAVPTVAAVRGAAVGAGLNLAFATDLRVVAPDARLIPGFAQLNIHPGGGHMTLNSRSSGRETATAMAVFGQELSGQRAWELGVAWEVVSAGEVEARALELARTAGADPDLARTAVRTLRLELGPPPVSLPVALQMERSAQLWSLARRGHGERATGS
jgi:enoyl-CoA hydratase